LLNNDKTVSVNIGRDVAIYMSRGLTWNFSLIHLNEWIFNSQCGW